MITTDAAIKRLKLPDHGRDEIRVQGSPGLFLRVSKTGMVWYFRARSPSEKTPIAIRMGPYGLGSEAFTLKEARRKAEDWKDAIKAGDDPRDEVKARKQRFKDDFEGTVERFLTQYVERNLKKNTHLQYKGILQGLGIEKWNSRPIHKIKRSDVIAVLDDIAESGRLVLANRTLAVLRRFFNWCADKDIIKADEVLPTDRVKPPLKKETRRKRVLSIEEVRVFWDACGVIGFPFGDCFKLLLVTGQRRSEVAAITRLSIDRKAKLWTQVNNKADRTHLLPLSDFSLSLFDGLPEFAGTDLIFTTNGETPIQGQSKAKKQLDKEIQKLISEQELQDIFVEHWQLHDLRRTFTTHLRSIGIGQDVCSSLLNHAVKGVTAEHYDHYDMLPEKVRAMDAWASFLETIINGKQDNVIDFKQV
jgi:integrase